MNRQKTLVYGLIAGSATIGYFLLFYFIQPRLFFHLSVQWASLLIFIGFMVLAVRSGRRLAGEGQYPWQPGLRAAFTVYVLAAVSYHLFYFLLYNYGAPELASIQEEVLMENLDRYKAVVGERNAENLRRDIRQSGIALTPGTALMALARSIIGGFVLSLVIGYLMRKE
ncbi:MAG: DUF4199 domain-containing protein [Haliscomenobacter sp.]|nr:DUF4199 domain-containing protein [Haliscomenobacter sp.]